MFRSLGSESTIPMGGVIITGTHSAGKTTLFEDYFSEGESVCGLDYGGSCNFYVTGREIGGVHVPIVGVPEAATLYAEEAHNPRILTTDYKMADQVWIEQRGLLMNGAATILAAEMAHQWNKSRSEIFGVLVTDRSPLDGTAYSAVRLPDEEQELFELRQLAAQCRSGFVLISHNEDGVYDMRKPVREAIATCDAVVMTDHTEVTFKPSELRESDLIFRDTIAGVIRQKYEEVVGPQAITLLRGSRRKRVEKLQSVVQDVMQKVLDATA